MSGRKSAAERMAAIFAGNRDLFYTADFMNARKDSNGKVVPVYDIVRRALTVADFEAHLAGRKGILGVPINAENQTTWGKIDDDNYPVNAKAYAEKIGRFKLPLITELTKSQGVHLGHYRRSPIAATELRDKLLDWASTLGCPSKSEIFPKQERLEPGDVPNGINLPYFGGDNAKNYALGPTGNRLTLDEYLTAVEAIQAMPDKPLHHAGEVNVEAVIDLLAQHWTDGQRDHINLAAAGAMLRAGLDETQVQEILEGARGAGADPETRRSVSNIARSLAAGKHITGVPNLIKLIGRPATNEFMRLIGSEPPPDLIPFSFEPNTSNLRTTAPAPLTFTVDPLLPQRVVGLLVAEGGAGKTTFNLRMAVAVAGGRPLFGFATTRGRVVYIGLEDTEASLHRRYHWIVRGEIERMRGEGASPDAIAEFEDALDANLTLRSIVGYELHLVTVNAGQTTQSATVPALIEKLPRPLELLILDPFSRLNGAEENSNSVGTAMINSAERIAREVQCTVLISHHTGKASAKERDKGIYGLRGASAIVDAARSSIRLLQADVKAAQEFTNVPAEVVAAGDLVEVIHNKSNDGPKAKSFWLRRQALDFERFEPELGSSTATHRAKMDALFQWFVAGGRLGFSQRRLDDAATRELAFRGLTVGRNEARTTVARALDEGDLVEGEATADRSNQKLLVFRGDFGDEL